MSERQYYDLPDDSQAQPPPWPSSANQSLIPNTSLWPAEFNNPSLMSLPSNPTFDSGYVDNHSCSDLADWHEKILQIWYDNFRRAACEDDISNFYNIFHSKVDRAVIESRLKQMFSCDERNFGLQHATDNYSAFDGNITTLLQPQTPAMLGSHFDIPIGGLWPGETLFPHDLPNTRSIAYGHPDSSVGLITAMPYQQPQNSNFTHSQFEPTPRKGFPFYIPEQIQLLNNGSTDDHANRAIDRRDVQQGLETGRETLASHAPPDRRTRSPHLTRLVNRHIRQCKRKTCGSRGGKETSQPRYACTLSCGRHFRSFKDLFRHEEIIYPQNFWFCDYCGNVDDPSGKYLFTRKDRILQHMKKYHSDSGRFDVLKVANIRPSFPKNCPKCIHHTHTSWKDRCTHIMRGCKGKRKSARNLELAHATSGTTSSIVTDRMNDQSDEDEESDDDDRDEEDKSDDQDDDDDDDEDGHAPDNDSGQGGASPTSDNPEGSQDRRSEHKEGSSGSKGTSAREADNYSLGLVHGWNMSTQLISPTLVSFTPLRHHQRPNRDLPVIWLGRINSKGGMASVYKVQLQVDPISGLSIATTTYAVKQYPAKHQTSFKRELNAYTILHSGMDRENHIIECYGTFECLDTTGDPTHNLLLEYAECDLSEYWAKTTPMGDSKEEVRSWKLMFSIASALQRVHQTRQIGTQHLHGFHSDLKPDNILWTRNGQWKLCDFGFTKFRNVRGSMTSRIYVDGGTRKYQAPESKYSSPVNQSYDVWSLGCVMFEHLVWISGDHGIYRASEEPQNPSSCIKRNSGRSGFHDGFGIRPRIKEWFRRLKNRTTDVNSITGRMLYIVENHLLVIDPSHRSTAEQLQCHLAEFLELHGTTRKSSDEILQVEKLMLAYELARSVWFFYERSWFDLPSSYAGGAPSSPSSSKLNKLDHLVWMDTLPGNVRDAIISTRVLGYRSVAVANGFIRVGQTRCPPEIDIGALHTTLVGVKDSFPPPPRRGRRLRSCKMSSTPGEEIWSKLDDSCIGILIYGRVDCARVSI